MIVAGLIFAALAAALHAFIFYLESVAWTSPRARAVFGTTAEEAEATKALAYNQGWYNLFLAVEVVVGIVVVAAGSRSVGLALVIAGCASMVAAALVLLTSDRSKASAALRQMAFALVALVLIGVGLAV